MNVVYFSAEFSVTVPVMRLLRLLRWLNFPEKCSKSTNGYNFLHFAAVGFLDSAMMKVIRTIMLSSVPKHHPNISKEVQRKYRKWLDTTAFTGQTPLIVSVMHANGTVPVADAQRRHHRRAHAAVDEAQVCRRRQQKF
ncbi:hypothetical protein CYMTET_35601 [Cymbomonas tetramitiformis]|uniref:Uncharacterized protein n=1 Tax=Cymbomonas tetramitiformis TaxID=36881 RepID=A0AAE0F8P4_9CHLO|nr:hypothetical protein CYMTET_35601 [Cymbomonas tetramitiformis]